MRSYDNSRRGQQQAVEVEIQSVVTARVMTMRTPACGMDGPHRP
jgi:hypothetical protein